MKTKTALNFFSLIFLLSTNSAQAEQLLNPDHVITINKFDQYSQDRETLPQNTAEYGLTKLTEGRENKFYQAAHKNFILEEYPAADLKTIVSKIENSYHERILNLIPSIDIREIKEELYEYVYPANYYHNPEPVTVKVKKIFIEAYVPNKSDKRFLVAYYVNYDKNWNNSVLFSINGHYSDMPSMHSLGLRQEGTTNYFAGKLATLGYPFITYDDSLQNNVLTIQNGESRAERYLSRSLIHVLADLLIIDQALLQSFDQVHALGISGGAERLYHYLMIHKAKLKSAYLAGFATPFWVNGDAKQLISPFTVNPDTDMKDDILNANFQLADLVLTGIFNGIKIALAQNTGESGIDKAGMKYELLPAVQKFTNNFYLGGDDINGDGIPDNGKNLPHDYDLEDYLTFLNKQISTEGNQ